jgi:hypothetical protein
LTTKAIQRHRGDGVGDGAALLRLSLARGPGGKSLQETAVWARLNGLAELTGQSLNERLHQSVAFLAGILHRLLAGRVAGKPLLWAGRCLRIADGSSLSQRGSKACPCEVAQRAGPHRFERKCSDCLIACGVGPDPDILSL